MKRLVLIVTASAELGELISRSLADTHQFDVHQYPDCASAVDFVRVNTSCAYALIEASLGDAAVMELGRSLRSIRRGIKIVLISRTKPNADLDEIRPWILLQQPFVLADLLATLDAVAPAVVDVEAVTTPAPRQLSWLEDPALAAQTLQSLATDASIEEAIVLRSHDVWASTGRLGDETVTKIKDLILTNVDPEQDFDLLRYMRLTDHQDQHGLWAKRVLVHVILAVIYDLSTSFSDMRKQTNALADALARPILGGPAPTELPALSAGLSLPRARRRKNNKASRSDGWQQPGFFDAPLTRYPVAAPVAIAPAYPAEALRRDDQDGEDNIAALGIDPEPNSDEFGSPAHEQRPGINRAMGARTPARQADPARQRPRVEANAFNLPGIPYSCLLTPRFQTHPLTGELAGLISATLRQVFTSYGWWLDSIDVRYDCLHWVAILPPTQAVADQIEAVRELTSAAIFEAAPEYMRENFSGDFWAPGYSVLAGADGHSDEQIRDFVLDYRNPRRRQDR